VPMVPSAIYATVPCAIGRRPSLAFHEVGQLPPPQPRLFDRVRADKDRVTMLPAVVKADLARHLESIGIQHQHDLQQGAGWVGLPTALARKYPNAGREWVWQWVFPATRPSMRPIRVERRRSASPGGSHTV
jgi:hypothetical protein